MGFGCGDAIPIWGVEVAVRFRNGGWRWEQLAVLREHDLHVVQRGCVAVAVGSGCGRREARVRDERAARTRREEGTVFFAQSDGPISSPQGFELHAILVSVALASVLQREDAGDVRRGCLG